MGKAQRIAPETSLSNKQKGPHTCMLKIMPMVGVELDFCSRSEAVSVVVIVYV